MDIVKKTVMFVVILVVGIMLVSILIPPATEAVLARPDAANYTGLVEFLRLLPLLATVGIVVGGVLLFFRHLRDDSGHGHDPGLPPGYTRGPHFPWRR